MGSNFAYRQLKDCATWYSGGTPRKSSPEFWNGDIPWISAKSLSGTFIATSEDKVTELGAKNGTRLLPKDSILFVVRGMSLKSEFRVGITTQEVTFNQDLKALVANDDIDPHFLMYTLKSKTHEILGLVEEAGHGTGVLPTPVIQQLEIPVPSLSTQKAIAKAILNFDNKITLNRQINQTLEQMAQTLFKSWFVDFDPVMDNALDTGNPIPDELQHRAEARKAVRQCRVAADKECEGFKPLPASLPKELRQLFPDAFEESELGWIPKGWPIQTIKDIAVVTDFVANGSFAALKENVTLYDEPEHALYVRTTDFKSGFDSAKAKYVDKKSYEFLSKSKLLGDEVIISNVGDVGTVFRPPVWLDLPMTLGSNAISVSASELNNYLYFHFSSHKGQKSIDGIVSGSAQQKFNKTGFRALTLVTPDADVIEAFNNRYSPLMLKAISNERNTILMTKLRDTLLPKLISGELRLDDVEAAVEQETVSV